MPQDISIVKNDDNWWHHAWSKKHKKKNEKNKYFIHTEVGKLLLEQPKKKVIKYNELKLNAKLKPK